MKLKDIKINNKNPRKINKDKFEKLKNSIVEFEKMLAIRPIIVDSDNIILGGNMRYQALKKLGYTDLKDEWVKKVDDLTEEETTQSNSGGMTDVYLDNGTYIKSIYTLLCSPSCAKIGMIGHKNRRLHHIINWDNAAVKIISQEHKK